MIRDGYFRRGIPVCPDRKTGYNDMTGYAFSCRAACGCAVLSVAGADAFKVYVNGAFVCSGPERAPSGVFRVTEREISSHLCRKENNVFVLVAGYGVNTYEYARNDSFLCLEIADEKGILCATDLQTRSAAVTQRVQKTVRYSFQRAFAEAWRFNGDADGLFGGAFCRTGTVKRYDGPCRFVGSDLPQPDYAVRTASSLFRGRVKKTGRKYAVKRPQPDFLHPSPSFLTFGEGELECNLADEIASFETLSAHSCAPSVREAIDEGEYAVFDLGSAAAGFLRLRVTSLSDASVYVLFDEILVGGDVSCERAGCVNAVSFRLTAGQYECVESFEPYALRYAKIIAAAGSVVCEAVSLVELAYPLRRPLFFCADASLARIRRAAAESFRFNAVDLFTDCPSRERAGWLCDGYFLGRAERAITGENRVERAFLEQFLAPCGEIPRGMVPMCAPAWHLNGNFIPNWSFWLFDELNAYFEDTKDAAFSAQFQPLAGGVRAWLERYENEYGLLENLPGWVFIEWSPAAAFVKDVSFPVNMHYARFLSVAGALFPSLKDEQKVWRLREQIRERSFDGQLFRDNAKRTEGVLVPQENRSEICQYYAFYTGIADRERDPVLWHSLTEGFPCGGEGEKVVPAQPFIGKYLRLELLSRAGMHAAVAAECRAYFGEMAEKTGTLWEKHDPGFAVSCCHGFASCVYVWLKRAAEAGAI